MLAHCRAAAEREGLSPALYTQSLHEFDLPRRYRTVVACGVFGLGSSRAEDVEALRRIHDHLEPGGVLVLDAEAAWRFAEAEPSPAAPAEPLAERRRGADGSEYALRSRLVDVDHAAQRTTMALAAWMWRDGELVAEEEHLLTESFYEREELAALLERAGFVDVAVSGYHGGAPTSDDGMVVFCARRPSVIASERAG